MNKRLLLVCVGLTALNCGVFSSRADAAPVLVQWGTAVIRLASLRPEYQGLVTQASGKPLAIGYKYSHFAIYLDLWTWGGEYCVFDGTTYRVISAEQARQMAAAPGALLSPPFVYRYPSGLLVLGFLLFAGIPAAYVVKRANDRSGPSVAVFSSRQSSS